MQEINQKILNQYVNDELLHVQHHPHLDLSIYNYTQKVQFENLWDEITLSCRGKIFNSSGLAITNPPKKFFNIEESKRYKSTDEFEVFEKVDGSFISICNYSHELIVASRGSFTSDHVGWAKEILKEKRKLLQGRQYSKDLRSHFQKGWTYCFELIWPENRIVVDYGQKKDLVLLAIIDESGVEFTYDEMKQFYGNLFTIVKRYDGIKDFTKIQELNTNNAEGFVVRFSNGDRVKIKFADYVRLHRVCTDLSTTRVYEALVAGSIDRWIEDIPDEFYKRIKSYANELQAKYDKIEKDAKSIYWAIENIASRKKFAEQAKSTKYSSLLFSMRDGEDYSKKIWKLVEPEFAKL